MHPVRVAALVVALLVAGAGAVAVAAPQKKRDKSRKAAAILRDADGDRVGRVELRQRGETVTISVRARDLPPGFHGFHVHAVGACRAPDFKSAMGHLKEGDQGHGAHLGDLPSLLVTDDGTARLVAETDRFGISGLRSGDGAAFMVHEKPDNFGNVPSRYVPQTDQETRDTGDAGPRIACGVVR
ncbi:MAG: superoxide dismutase family protein [Actinomycetota bacterium]|nr:superoxide dismutase family protein [Actinomycetota bacterium]